MFRRRSEPHSTQEPVLTAGEVEGAIASKINNLRYRFLERRRRLQDARPGLVKMSCVPPARDW